MKPKIPPLAWLGIGLCLLLIFSGGKGCTTGVTVAPYPLPQEIPIAVAVAVDASPTGLLQLTIEYPGVLAQVHNFATTAKGQYRLIDTNNQTPPQYDDPWVQAAWKVIDKTKPPQIIAATPTSGFPSQPLPKTPAEVDKLLAPLVKQ